MPIINTGPDPPMINQNKMCSRTLQINQNGKKKSCVYDFCGFYLIGQEHNNKKY